MGICRVARCALCQQCCFSTCGNGGTATSTEAFQQEGVGALEDPEGLRDGQDLEEAVFVLDYAIQVGLQQEGL